MVKNNLPRVLNDANTFYASDGSYANATYLNLLVLDPYFTWGHGPSSGVTNISIDVEGSSNETFAATALSLSGECFGLRVTNGTTLGYGITATDANCTGAWASANATASDGWPV